LEDSQVASNGLEDSQVAPKELEDGASGAPLNAPSNTVFVGNIAYRVQENEIRKVFSRFGEIIEIRMHYYQHGRSTGACHIDFASKDGAVAAVTSKTKNPVSIAGRKLRVEFSEANARKVVTEPSNRLYFSGFAGEESEIRTIFQQFRESIVDVYPLVHPRTGKRAHNGFVNFNSIEAATKAMEALNGTQTPNGETLTVTYARPLRPKSRVRSKSRS